MCDRVSFVAFALIGCHSRLYVPYFAATTSYQLSATSYCPLSILLPQADKFRPSVCYPRQIG
jgi:hypothetical protein